MIDLMESSIDNKNDAAVVSEDASSSPGANPIVKDDCSAPTRKLTTGSIRLSNLLSRALNIARIHLVRHEEHLAKSKTWSAKSARDVGPLLKSMENLAKLDERLKALQAADASAMSTDQVIDAIVHRVSQMGRYNRLKLRRKLDPVLSKLKD